MIYSSKPSSHIVRSLVYTFSTIGNKTCSKDHNLARHVLSLSIMNKRTRELCLLMHTPKLINLNVKTLCRYCIKREQIETIKHMSGTSLVHFHALI